MALISLAVILFLALGGCDRYHHNPEYLAASQLDEKGRKACGHFAKTGKCNAGESCPLAPIEVEGAKGKKERCVDYFIGQASGSDDPTGAPQGPRNIPEWG